MVGDLFHVCNRGVDKKNIFCSTSDYIRFVENLYRLNNKEGAIRSQTKISILKILPDQDKLVEILKWSLLSNHYHLILSEAVEGGAIEFVKRLGNSFTKYFNTKYGRSGYLFQNSAKITKVDNDAYYRYLPLYVDLNPLSIRFNKWKEEGVEPGKAIDFLNCYRWSSFGDYHSKEHFPMVINKQLFFEEFSTNAKEEKKEYFDYLSDHQPQTQISQPGRLTDFWQW